MNRYDLQGRNAIVTGGAGGFGNAIAKVFLASGARVSLWDASASGLASTLGALAPEYRERVSSRPVDISNEGQVRAAVEQDRQTFGRIDILVNNAGILGPLLPLW